MPLFGEVGQDIAQSWQAGTRDMAVEATSATMRVIATALFSGDPRLTTPEAMDHITAAMEGVGEARIQALLGMPLIPVTRKGGGAGQGSSSCVRRWARSCASGSVATRRTISSRQ
ncbi:cytochrome P450 [Sphingomonas sediminicola]|nr:cytochrome P450 [Sphingomonas sediminicola]